MAGGGLARWRRALHGPSPVLPAWLDALSECWASLSARGRAVVALSGIVLFLSGCAWWAAGVAARWGGSPVPVLVAERQLAPGDAVTGLRLVELPPAAVPSAAATDVPEGARMAFALPAGSVLTQAHLDARGPGAALPEDQRAMPIPVEEGWRVTAGGWVDVWVLGMEDRPSVLVAAACPVLAVAADDMGAGTALVALPRAAVGEVAQGLTAGRVLLAHAPPPG
ncbi:MAG TPA: SAF domain-containing protein [Egibacteraceae bacterium]|nr:SAF domain-containing protein [Egibacteraceae bacterium]